MHDVALFGPRLKTEGTYKISLVHPSIRPEWLFSKSTLRIFLKLGMKLGHHRGSNVTWPFFCKNLQFRENFEKVLKKVHFFKFLKNGSKKFCKFWHKNRKKYSPRYETSFGQIFFSILKKIEKTVKNTEKNYF